jgi:hypothetical protein
MAAGFARIASAALTQLPIDDGEMTQVTGGSPAARPPFFSPMRDFSQPARLRLTGTV